MFVKNSDKRLDASKSDSNATLANHMITAVKQYNFWKMQHK